MANSTQLKERPEMTFDRCDRSNGHLAPLHVDKKQNAKVWFVIATGTGGAFLVILNEIVKQGHLTHFDETAHRIVQSLRSAKLDAVMIVFTELGDTSVVRLATTTILVSLVRKREWRTAGYWLFSVAGASVMNTLIKLSVRRARPGEFLYRGSKAFSFPSGHSTTNVVLYGFLAYLLARNIQPSLRPSLALGAALPVSMIAFSRLYLGAHWFSDVAGGVALGTCWLTAMISAYSRSSSATIGSKNLIALASMSLALGGVLNIYRQHTLDVRRYTNQSRKVNLRGDVRSLA